MAYIAHHQPYYKSSPVQLAGQNKYLTAAYTIDFTEDDTVMWQLTTVSNMRMLQCRDSRDFYDEADLKPI